MRIAPFLLIAALPCLAQTPSTIEILADQSQVVVGRTVQARAYVHDSTGKIIDTPVTWSLNQPNAATISSTVISTAPSAIEGCTGISDFTPSFLVNATTASGSNTARSTFTLTEKDRGGVLGVDLTSLYKLDFKVQ